jgi:hypothetical protein
MAKQHPDIVKQIKTVISSIKDDTHLRTFNEIDE